MEKVTVCLKKELDAKTTDQLLLFVAACVIRAMT